MLEDFEIMKGSSEILGNIQKNKMSNDSSSDSFCENIAIILLDLYYCISLFKALFRDSEYLVSLKYVNCCLLERP